MGNGKNFWQGLVDGARDLAPGLGVASSFAKGLIGNFFEKQSLDYQAQLNEQAAVNAYNRQLDFWNKQNAYNDPSAQMQRLMAAGLNPAMINANGVNNTAGGLSSVPQSSPGSPNNNKPSPTDELNALADYAYKIKEMGFLDQQTQAKIEEILTIRVERELKKLEGALKLTETEKANLDYTAFYEASYGESIDGGPVTIKNNPYTEKIRAARAEIALNDANKDLAEANTSYTKALEKYQNDRNDREALLALADEALKKAQANAAYAAAAASLSQAKSIDASVQRENQRLEMEKEIHNYLKEIEASEAEIAKTNAWLAELWSKDAKTLMDEHGLYRAEIVRARWRDFIHNNLRLSGNAGYSKK